MLINKHMSNDCSSSSEIYEIRLMIRIDDWNCHALNKCRNCLLNIWFWNYHCVRLCVWVWRANSLPSLFSSHLILSLQSHRQRAYTMRSFARSLHGIASHHDRLHFCAICTQFSSIRVIHWKYHRCNFHSRCTNTFLDIFVFGMLDARALASSLVSSYLLHWYAQYTPCQ